MANRFGRNQKRKMQTQVLEAQREAQRYQMTAHSALDKMNAVMRDQLSRGTIPLEVEHFLDREGRDIVMHVIFDERRANLHYQHKISPSELQIQRDKDERERLGLYLGRAIADQLAEAYAGREKGSSRAEKQPPPQISY